MTNTRKSCKTRSHPQEKNWKHHKYTEVKQHVTKQCIDQSGDQRRNLKSTLKQMKMKTRPSKTFGM